MRSAKFFQCYISLAASSFSTRNRNIIYQCFSILQMIFKKKLHFFAIFSGFSGEIRGDRGKMAENSGDKTGGRLALCRVPRGAKLGYGVERRSTEREATGVLRQSRWEWRWARIKPVVGGWRDAECHVERNGGTDGYGRIRTATDKYGQ